MQAHLDFHCPLCDNSPFVTLCYSHLFVATIVIVVVLYSLITHS